MGAVDMDLSVSTSLVDGENDGEEKMSAGLVVLPSIFPYAIAHDYLSKDMFAG